ncbi:kelch domain-containing protein 1-like isoform X2 [Dreissena polymorpha]|uniref:Uncharacterized protein n=2 Tax=Dreissena polymorpha TaxID=45954 RepID=A0A9D4ENS5_DREPO|nr:kelch domain-containing protein 1-like isoform X2 [Dreissena polymorpha]XP_052224685.1 kelch domain-containing protein 1-like isoform X2 [Dreissena polymorpha]XP_052224686.1 kelch domain-containing protein 1-like isoform X2 [Dreissena polymorpha]KAH3781796.1 hypothetical protein DPMN_159702 [Dreissena polymorpha]
MEKPSSSQLSIPSDIALTWKRAKDCPFPKREGQCGCSVGNKMYLFGGVVQTEDGDLESNDLLCYDAESGCWSKLDTKTPRPEACIAASLAAVGNKLYLFGGLNQESGWLGSLHMLDLDTLKWTELTGEGIAPSPRDKLQAAVIDTRIYYFGGFGPKATVDDDDDEDWEDEDDEGGVAEVERTQQAAEFGWFNDLYVYDTLSNKWSQPMHMNLGLPTARAAHGMCAVGRNLVIFGGRDTEKRTNDLYMYNIDTRKWNMDMKITGQLPAPRSFHSTTAMGGRVVVVGGRGVDDKHLADLHVFDTETYQWLQPGVGGDVPAARGQHSVAVVRDNLVVFGGSSDYDPQTMSCQKLFSDTYTILTGDILKGGSTTQVHSGGDGGSS